jgi:hypothetical protein
LRQEHLASAPNRSGPTTPNPSSSGPFDDDSAAARIFLPRLLDILSDVIGDGHIPRAVRATAPRQAAERHSSSSRFRHVLFSGRSQAKVIKTASGRVKFGVLEQHDFDQFQQVPSGFRHKRPTAPR